MKKIIVLSILFVLSISAINAQDLNWKWIKDKKQNYVHLQVGYDFGVTTQFGYCRSVTLVKPILFTLDYSFPMGGVIFDDFKFRYGGQLEIIELNNFIASFKLFGNFKRYETELVRIINFGTETSIILGYYKPGWHLALELGIIKPIISDLKHSEIMKEDYPTIKDGWYKSSGGYCNYGIQFSKSVAKSFNISFRVGYTNALADNKGAMLPYYTQLGMMYSFK